MSLSPPGTGDLGAGAPKTSPVLLLSWAGGAALATPNSRRNHRCAGLSQTPYPSPGHQGCTETFTGAWLPEENARTCLGLALRAQAQSHQVGEPTGLQGLLLKSKGAAAKPQRNRVPEVLFPLCPTQKKSHHLILPLSWPFSPGSCRSRELLWAQRSQGWTWQDSGTPELEVQGGQRL